MAKANTKPSAGTSQIIEFDPDAIRKTELKVAQETDEQIMTRMAEHFQILEEMTKAVRSGDIRAMIVSGPPGVGKSFGVEKVLEVGGLMDTLADRKQRYEVVKGSLSAIGLYAKLHEFSEKGNVLVFDDADNIFYDTTCLNLLKAALDTSQRRFISWNTDSRLLRSEGIPDRFEFKAAVIFISNLKFAHIRSKALKDHLTALESRCHYIDLEIDTTREKLLRIKQVINDTDMLGKYDFPASVQTELVKFIDTNKDKFREISLRTVLKLSDLRKTFPKMWQMMARTTLMKKG